MKRALPLLAICALLCATVARSADATVVTAQILDYEGGYVFFTTGDGFRVSPGVTIVDLKSGATAAPPAPREFARVTFDASGVVTKLELSRARLPAEDDLAAVRRFAIALSSPAPNPDLAPVTTAASGKCPSVKPGKTVTLNITVQVPSTTPLTDTVYMTSDQSGWNAQAYRFDRRDALHYRAQLKLLSGTVLHILFDRGSTQSIQVGENGIEQAPIPLCVGDEDAKSLSYTVYHWADQQVGSSLPIPQSMPTPYNPAPFPNLPTPQPRPT